MESTFSGLKYSKSEVDASRLIFVGSRLSHGPLLLHCRDLPS